MWKIQYVEIQYVKPSDPANWPGITFSQEKADWADFLSAPWLVLWSAAYPSPWGSQGNLQCATGNSTWTHTSKYSFNSRANEQFCSKDTSRKQTLPTSNFPSCIPIKAASASQTALIVQHVESVQHSEGAEKAKEEKREKKQKRSCQDAFPPCDPSLQETTTPPPPQVSTHTQGTKHKEPKYNLVFFFSFFKNTNSVSQS